MQNQKPAPLKAPACAIAGVLLTLGCCFSTGLCARATNLPDARDVSPAPDARLEAPTATNATSLALILDTSGSMSEAVGSEGSKLDIAKSVLVDDFLPSLSDDLYLAFYRFRYGGALELAPLRRCGSLDAPKWLHREVVMSLALATEADGATPIVGSLSHTRSVLAPLPGRKLVVLVTDGEASDGNPETVIAELDANTKAGLETFVVGFNLGGQGAYLRDKLGDGKNYFAANGGREPLLKALASIAAALEK